MASRHSQLKATRARKAAQGIDPLTADLLRTATRLSRSLYGRDLTTAERRALVEDKTIGEVLDETAQ